MRYGLFFELLAAAMVWFAFDHGGVWFILIWPAASIAVMGAGYLGLGEKVCGKKPSGGFVPWALILHFPYRLYCLALWHAYRLLEREPPTQDIGGGITIGRRLLPSEIPGDFNRYIDLSSEVAEPARVRAMSTYHCFPILDAGCPDAGKLLAEIDQLGGEDERVYLHCMQGHGRTALVALFLLARRGKIDSPADGMALLKKYRPGVGLNKSQRRFAEQYFPKPGDNMFKSESGDQPD